MSDSTLCGTGLVLGILFGFCIGFSSSQEKYDKIIEKCEANLPRNQFCQLVGVPDEQRNSK